MSSSKIFAAGAAIGALFLAVCLSPALAADSCPDLSGTFDCPALGKQPAMTLTVTNKSTIDGGMLYKFTYRFMGRDISSEGDALPKESKKADPANLCSGGVYYHKAASEPGDGTHNSLNADGNYERASGGKVEMVCVRKK